MLKISKEESQEIRNGNLLVLKKVLLKEREEFRKRLVLEKEDIRFVQGAAYYSDELCKLFE